MSGSTTQTCAFMGTVVSAGEATAVVYATGANAEFGRIAAGLGEREPETDFQIGLRRVASEHDELRDTIGLLRAAADRLAAADPAALETLAHAHAFLTDRLLPHEQAEETQLYPALAHPLGSSEATATMSSTHAEIQRLSARIGTHIALAQASNGIQPGQVEDLLACLYGLYALLQLHFLQEEENYFTLADVEPESDDYRRPGTCSQVGGDR